jgi:hypothetical protein
MPQFVHAQEMASRELRIAPLGDVVDGVLNEPLWKSADVAADFLQADPVEGAPPTGVTRVRPRRPEGIGDRHRV